MRSEGGGGGWSDPNEVILEIEEWNAWVLRSDLFVGETSIINICLNTKNLLLCVLDIHHLAFVLNIQNSLASSPWPRTSWFIWLVQNFSRSFLKHPLREDPIKVDTKHCNKSKAASKIYSKRNGKGKYSGDIARQANDDMGRSGTLIERCTWHC